LELTVSRKTVKTMQTASRRHMAASQRAYQQKASDHKTTGRQLGKKFRSFVYYLDMKA
jgi:hypothetical protein